MNLTVDAPASFPITSKGQVTLPRALRQQLGLGRGSGFARRIRHLNLPPRVVVPTQP